MKTKNLEFLEELKKINKNDSKLDDINFKNLLDNKNFKNNQNYIISRYIKSIVIKNYNLHGGDDNISETKDFRKVRYLKHGNIKSNMIVNFVLFLLIIVISLYMFILEYFANGTAPGILILLIILFAFILTLRIGGLSIEKTSNDYIFYKNKNNIYYKLK